MSLLGTATAANVNPPGDCYDEDSNEVTMPSKSPTSKGSNQMDTEEGKELGKHHEDFVKHNEDEEEPADPLNRFTHIIPFLT